MGYGLCSLILIYAATTFESQDRTHVLFRFLLFCIAIFLLAKIPSTLNHLVMANDAVNAGILNSTQVADLIRSNNTYTTILVRLPYIILAYFFVWWVFIRFTGDAGKAYKEAVDGLDHKPWEKFKKGGKKW